MGDSRVSQVTTSLDDLNRRLQDLEQQRNSTYNPYQSALGSAPTSHLPTSSMAYGSSGSTLCLLFFLVNLTLNYVRVCIISTIVSV